jgi:RhtB (resistance to homoserine/threonine) family protein
MSHAVVLISVFAVFIPALLLPGPDFVAVVRSSMTHGTRAGLLTTVGVSTGLCLYATLSLLGLSAILVKYQWLTWVVRAAGGAYLIYLGIKLLRAKPQAIELDAAATRPQSKFTGKRAILFGFLVTLTNPKAIVLFTSVFATAVTASTPLWLMGTMIAIVTVSSLSWYACVSLFMSSGPVMRRFQRARHWIERSAGVCFIGLGGKVLADAGTPVTP